MYTKELLNHIHFYYSKEGKEKLFEFFIVFSRFEYALKYGNFSIKSEKSISPDWCKFASSIKNDFNEKDSPELEKAVAFILTNPPKMQVFVNETMIWKDRKFPTKEPIIQKLKTHICDIRNNLFHGGKFNDNFEPEISRDFELLKSALIILENWLMISNQINQNFLLPN